MVTGNRASTDASGNAATAEPLARLAALDGLRGIAALIVFVEHFMLTIPIFSDVFMQSASTPPSLEPNSLAWWLSYTPLHIIWQGTGAVYIFFILSGYVLSLPALRMLQAGSSPDQAATSRLRGYYIRRMLRLYLPVWGAIALGLAAIAIIPRTLTGFATAPLSGGTFGVRPDELSSWLTMRGSIEPNPFTIAQDASLLFGAGEIVSPLWTLQWELWFSLLLPLYLFLALTFRHSSGTVAVIAFTLVTFGALSGIVELVFLPMFLIGVVLATARDRIRSFNARLTPSIRTALFIAAIILLTSQWWLLGFAFIPESYQLTVATTLLGATCIVFLALHGPLLSRMLSSRPLVTLGRFSFSLYLVHEPILVSVAYLFPNQHLIVALLSLISVAAVTIAFYYLIERPSQHLGRLLARRFAR